MVQLMNSGNILPESEAPCRNKLPVKLEVENSLDEEHGRLNKRSKLSSSFQQQWSVETNVFSFPSSQYNPLDEPSPLGLRLKKSPSFLDLIQMRLAQGNPPVYGENLDLGKKDLKGAEGLGTAEKLKASNFPASLLRIGTWECVSRYEGDLVAKCYYAKHKLVWEVLDGGLKSKIEIQWSDIMALKANCPDKGPGTLDVVLSRQPLFFRETNPQPRKHTLWQATSDFTDEEASIHRRHFLQCPRGVLSKHFEKLIQCDPRLNLLSQQPEIVLESPYFDSRASVFEDPNESNSHEFDSRMSDDGATSSLLDAVSPSAVQSSSMKNELLDHVSQEAEHLSRETPSPSSVMDNSAIEESRNNEVEERKGLGHWDQFRMSGLHPSMSMSDLVSHIGQCISDQMSAGNPLFSGEKTKDILEDMAQYMLSDAQCTASDEQSLISRVNSLCCLLQKDHATVQNSPNKCEGSIGGLGDGRSGQLNSTFKSSIENMALGDFPAPEGESHGFSGCKQVSTMPRKDSFGDLLLHLPRIASLPQFLFNISEGDDNNQAR